MATFVHQCVDSLISHSSSSSKNTEHSHILFTFIHWLWCRPVDYQAGSGVAHYVFIHGNFIWHSLLSLIFLHFNSRRRDTQQGFSIDSNVCFHYSIFFLSFFEKECKHKNHNQTKEATKKKYTKFRINVVDDRCWL